MTLIALSLLCFISVLNNKRLLWNGLSVFLQNKHILIEEKHKVVWTARFTAAGSVNEHNLNENFTATSKDFSIAL